VQWVQGLYISFPNFLREKVPIFIISLVDSSIKSGSDELSCEEAIRSRMIWQEK